MSTKEDERSMTINLSEDQLEDLSALIAEKIVDIMKQQEDEKAKKGLEEAMARASMNRIHTVRLT